MTDAPEDDLVTRLEARTFRRWESDIQALMEYSDPLCTEAADRITSLEAHLREAEATIGALREGLRPFAALADDYLADTVNFDDDTIIAGRMTRRGEEGTPPRVTFAATAAPALSSRTPTND